MQDPTSEQAQLNSEKNSPSKQEKEDQAPDLQTEDDPKDQEKYEKQIENIFSSSNCSTQPQENSLSSSELKKQVERDNLNKKEINKKEKENLHEEHKEVDTNEKKNISQEPNGKTYENPDNIIKLEMPAHCNDVEKTNKNKHNNEYQFLDYQTQSEKNENSDNVKETEQEKTENEKTLKAQTEDPNNDNMPKQKVSKEDFEILGSLGKGSFGEVHLVRKIGGEELYAMKGLDKHFLFKVKKLTNRNK